MQITAGRNLKITVGRSNRPALTRLFAEVLGCGSVRPSQDIEIFRLGDGFSVGLFYVDDALALTEAQQRLAAWLEFTVSDVQGAVLALDAASVARVPYSDTAHTYFQMPGGPVFRVKGA